MYNGSKRSSQFTEKHLTKACKEFTSLQLMNQVDTSKGFHFGCNEAIRLEVGKMINLGEKKIKKMQLTLK